MAIRVFYVIAVIIPARVVFFVVRTQYDEYKLRRRLEHIGVTLQTIRTAPCVD